MSVFEHRCWSVYGLKDQTDEWVERKEKVFDKRRGSGGKR